ncbi:MAG: chemotaxis protein CheA [Pseudomonadota bacterium]
MGEDDDYKALFFSECAELLADLQEHLGALRAAAETNEGGDAEAVNAAFRAVHSVKGGAAAFGFDQLTDFAHQFETVMDKCRSGALKLSAELTATLLRSGDVMELLVEAASREDLLTDPLVDRMLEDLRAALGDVGHDIAAPAIEPGPMSKGPADSQPTTACYTIRVAPDDRFLASGHDPIELLSGLAQFGDTSVSCEANFDDLANFDASACSAVWTVSVQTERPLSEIQNHLELYELATAITYEAVDTAMDNAAAASKPDTPQAVVGSTQKAEPCNDAPPPKPKTALQKSLRVELNRIDRLVNLVGEIVVTQSALAQEIADMEATGNMDVPHSMEAMAYQTRELQESVMAIRAQPMKTVFSRLPRLVRDLSDKLRKDVRLDLVGEATEVDTTVIEELIEPLTHMLRNAMDHGLERPEERLAAGKSRIGVITLSAEHRGERVVLKLSDDGRGLDREKVLSKALAQGLVADGDHLSPEEIDHLIFHPGFSTAETVSDVSGRGVGMDVVKRKIQSLGGRCGIHNRPGEGTTFVVTLPLTLAVLDGMTVSVGDDRFILPLSTVVEALKVSQADVEVLPDGRRLLARRGQFLPLISLRECIGLSGRRAQDEMAVILETETQGNIALLVDDLLGQRQVVLKSLEANYHAVEGISGATILGDGRVALIVDVPALPLLAPLPSSPSRHAA